MPITKRMASEDYVSTTVEETVVLKINENSMPLPPTAAVGQYIVVSAVDESGKVTATEAVNAPTLPDAEEVSF